MHAAAEVQRRLDAEAWINGADVCVRMGLHTGEPSLFTVIILAIALMECHFGS